MSLFTCCLRQLFLVLFLGSSYAAFATIDIVAITPSGAGGVCNGSITLIAQGTAGPFQIEVVGPTSRTLENINDQVTIPDLCDGSYEIIVTNAYGCEKVLTTKLGCSLQVITDITPSCTPGGGAISFTPQNGTPPYKYKWRNVAGTFAKLDVNPITNLAPDDYLVTVTDANGCIATATAPISTKPTGEDATYPYIKKVEVYVKVNGVNTLIYEGEWTLSPPNCLKYRGDTKPIVQEVYDAIKNGQAAIEIKATASKNLALLNVDLASIDEPQPTKTGSGSTWNFTYPPTLSASILVGSAIQMPIHFTGEDARGDKLLNLRQLSKDFTQCATLPTLGANCTWNPKPVAGTDDVHVVKTSCISTNFSVALNTIEYDCDGLADVCLKIENGGNGTYTYQWQTGQTVSCAQNLTAGQSYVVTVTDGCGQQKSKTIPVPPSTASPLSIQIAGVQEYCGATQRGSINVTAFAGKPPYTYYWSGDNGFTANTAQISNLGTGQYCVTVTDQCNQSAGICYTIMNVASNIAIQEVQNIPSCGTNGTGSLVNIDVSPAGTYQYRWSNGATTEDLQNVAAGAYTLSVTDANGCVTTYATTIEQYAPITMQLLNQIDNPTSCGATDGAIWFKLSPNTYFDGGTRPYTLKWADGKIGGGPFYNLSSGIYTLTVTDAKGCKGRFDLELIGQDEPQILSEIVPACENVENGILYVTAYSEVGYNSYTYDWTNGTHSGHVENMDELLIENASAGNYSVTITDATVGATCQPIVKTFTVPALTATANLQVEAIVKKTCAENPTGSLQLQINGGVPFPTDLGYYSKPYLIEWENSYSSDESLISLESGMYRVTVTDYCGNSIAKEFKIETNPNEVFDVVATDIKHTTSEDDYGKISVAPTISGTYNYLWNNNANTPTIYGLTPDVYTVTVTNTLTGCKVIRPFEVEGCVGVESFDVVITGGSALDPLQPIEFQALIQQGDMLFGENVPSNYSIIWKEPIKDVILGYGTTLSLSNNYPHNTVRVIVSNGCYEKEVYRNVLRCNSPNSTLSSFFIIKKELPCIGSNDGSVTLSIPNNLEEEIAVKLNGISLPTYKQGKNEIVNIGSLSGLLPYTIDISIGNCIFSFSFELKERETLKEFDYVDKEKAICFFRQSCDGVSYGNELYQEQARLDWDNAPKAGIFNTCKAPMYCRDRGVGYKDFETRWVSAKEYQYILNNGGRTDYMLTLSNLFEDQHLCKKVLYCKGDLTMITHVPIGPRITFKSRPDNFTSDEPLEIKPDGNGCLDIKCRSFLFFGSNTFKACPSEADDPYNITRPKADDDCLIRSGNIYELYIIYKVLKNQLLTLENTELGKFLNDWGNEDWAKCATVTFCSKDLRVIGDNRASVNCQSQIPSCDGNGFVGQACTPFPVKDENDKILGYRVTCIGSGGFCSPEAKLINNCEVPGPGITIDLKKSWDDIKHLFKNVADASGNVAVSIKTAAVDAANFTFEAAKGAVKFLGGLSNSGPACPEWNILPGIEQEELFPKVVLDTFKNEVLQIFGTAKYAGIPIPRGISRSRDNNIYYKYDDSEDQIQKDVVKDIDYVIEDWDYEHFIYVRQILKDRASELVYEDTTVAWVNNIVADDSFSIKHLSSQGYHITLGGTFKGALVYDSVVVANSDSLAAFLFRIDKDGMLLNAHIFENVASTNDIFFSENLNRSIAIAAKHKGDMKVNGASLGLGTSAGFATLSIDSLDQVQLIKDLKGGVGMRLLDLTYTADSLSANFAVAISGTDTLNANGEFVFKNNTPKLNIATFSQNGALQWNKAVPATDINLDKFDMAYTYSDSLFVGVTFRDTLSFFNQVLQSRGGEDIALVKITPDGTSQWHRNYGTAEDETVSKLMYSYGILYFGGEFTGSTGDKTIGKYVFSNLIEANTKSYISYIYDELPLGNEPVELRSSDYMALESNVESIPANIAVYPNPFTGAFTIRTDGQVVSKIGITNSIGQSVYNFDSGDLNQIDIDFTGKENGLYFVKVYGISGALIGTKKIVKAN